MRGWSRVLLGIACLAGVAAARAETPEDALAAELAAQRVLLAEARVLAPQLGSAPAATAAQLAAFEGVLIEEGLLSPDSAAPRGDTATPPPVSAGLQSGPAPGREDERTRLARLVVSDAPRERVEGELEGVVRAEPGADARALVQDVLFRAVAITAVALRQQLDELRRNEEFRAAVREQLLSLRDALASASEQARSARDDELRELEGRLAEAGERAGRAAFDLEALLGDQQALFARLSRLGGRLYVRAKLVLREAGS